jgi:ssDNA-binding Zn-finger/Zn-ribbon topoisomerase 1
MERPYRRRLMRREKPADLTCPYCGAKAKLVDSIAIYKTRSYGMLYVCTNYPNCDAYVGCHPNTIQPLGRLADHNLRIRKHNAHSIFDTLWKGNKRIMTRTKAYEWLSSELNIPIEECHIGMFDITQCKKVVEVCSKKKKEGR